MTQRERVIEHVSNVIVTLGIKSVRMDDVANEMGMSKRTLYEMFGDKEELLYEGIVRYMDNRYEELSMRAKQFNNMLEILLESVRSLCNNGMSGDVECRLTTNLKKFYPVVHERVQRYHSDRGLKGLQYALDKCREEGYLDEHVDIELMARLFLTTAGMLISDKNIILPENISRQEAFGAMVVNFLRGLASQKGLQVIDEILAREPRPATLQERRNNNIN
ncbi:MAG: TetR/AcrR family transcriptional regulator [Alistipes sp.]|nr:TetR/AcrR family transcriptional regulator [Alistipes sp.]